MKKAIYWFRKNLRINDNPSLYNAINENDEVIQQKAKQKVQESY